MSIDFVLGFLVGVVMTFTLCGVWYILSILLDKKNGKTELQN